MFSGISKKLLIKLVNLKKNQKKYFVAFHADLISYKRKLLENLYHIIMNNNISTTFNCIWSPWSSKRLKNIHNFVINKFTKIIFFRELQNLFTKDITYKNYKIMRRKFKEDFNYMSETFYFPKDKKIIETKFKNYKFNRNNMLVKPTNKNSGEGISILTS